jgi:periplasmic copper chaperone A
MRARIVIAIVVALVCAPAAQAHVTVNPDRGVAGDFARFAIRVPTERPNASTVSVTVRLPEGVFFVSFQPKPGWTRRIVMQKLDEPVELFGDQVTERVAQVTWTGGRIAPGEFDEFGMSARLPDKPGQLVFPSLQRYSNGEIVRWIGPPDADEPAPRVEVRAAAPQTTTATATNTATTEEEHDEHVDRANLAIGLGIAGLLAGLVALGVSLRRRA